MTVKKQIVDLFIYRWRYILGYGSLVLFLIFAIVMAGLYAPGGLSQTEIDALTPITSLSVDSLAVVNPIYHLIQTAIFWLFGVSLITIKLPTILLSIISSIVIFFLLRRWFKSSVTILTMLITIATSQYLFVAQSATPIITYVLYSALILLFASLILQKTKHQLFWKIGLAASMALSMYSPYFIYINLGLIIVALIHPHTRYHIFRKSQRFNWLVAGIVFITLVLPLIYLATTNHSVINDLLGLASLADFSLISGLKALLFSFFWIEPLVVNGQIVPILDFATLVIVILGLIVSIKNFHMARTYMIGAWILLTLPIVIINPESIALASIPLIILMAIGIETLLGEWYKLFPKNPYARGGGLILIVGMIGVMIVGGIDRFSNGYMYMPSAALQYNTDINLMVNQLNKKPVRTLVVVDESELNLYNTLAKFHKNKNKFEVVVATNPAGHEIGNIIMTRKAHENNKANGLGLQYIITDDKFTGGDRLYLYKSGENTL